MNAPTIINAAHEVLLRAEDALSVTDVARELNGTTKPNKSQIKAAERLLKELHGLGMIEPEVRAGGVSFYRLIVVPKAHVCDLVQTEGESQASAPVERVLTPEAEAEREQFISEFGYDGNCSCHISPPCNSCMHPGNPRNQEEEDTAWMAAGDSEGGETDAPVIAKVDPNSGARVADFATDEDLQYLAPEDYEMPPADPALLAMANRAISGQLDEFRAQLSSIAETVAPYLPDPSDISTARAVEILDMLAEAQTGHILAQESALETRIQAWVKERGDISHVLEEIVFEPFTTSLLDHAKTAANAFSALSAKHETLKHQITELRTRAAEQAAQYQADIARISSGLAAERQAMNNAINEADRLRAELAAERQAREALQEQAGSATITAPEYIVLRSDCKVITRHKKLETAVKKARAAVRAGAAKADVIPAVRAGSAHRGVEWKEA